MAAVATAALTGCGSKENKVETTEFVDDVKVSLADSGRIANGLKGPVQIITE